LAAVLFLVLSLNSAPSVPSVPDPLEGVEIPTPEEVRALEELADWLLGERGLEAMSPRTLSAAIRSRPRTFEIFRSYNPVEARRRYVVGLPYGEQIFTAARRHGLDSLLVASLVEAESSFLPRAVSPQGAVGLMQVMPATGRGLGPGGALDLGDPTVNLDVGVRYLRNLLTDYDGDLELALAAYNAGPAAVDRFDGVPPYRETRAYLARVLSTYVEHHRRVWEESGADELFELR
jgi:soluble lytic murein transglycosylase-like protein